MDPNTNKIYLAIGATATILAGALGYYILVLKKSKNKDQITKPPPYPPVVVDETANLEEKKKAAAAFISQKLNSNEEFQTFSSKNVGLAVTKDIQDNNGIVDDKSSEAVDNNEEGQENSDMEEFEEEVLCQSTPNLLTESVCEDLQIEPPSINSNETEPTIVLDNTHLERSQSPDDVILTNNPSAIVNNDKLASDRSPSVSPVPCECLENWKEDEKSESETSPKIEKSRSPSPEKEKSRTPSPENFERGEVVMAEEKEEEKVPSRSPSPVKEKSSSPSPVKENSRSPSLDKEDDDDIVVVEKEVSPSASPEKEKSCSPSPAEEKSRSSSPLVVKEKSRSPSPEKEKSRSVSPVNEKAPEKSRSPSPVDSKKSLSPV